MKTLAVNRIRAVKRDNAGTAQYTAAPTPAVSATAVGTFTGPCGLTVTANLIKGKLSVKNTNATKAATLTGYCLTPAGSVKLGSTSGTGTKTTGFTKSGQFYPPGSIKLVNAVTAGAFSFAKAVTISINKLTSIRRE